MTLRGLYLITPAFGDDEDAMFSRIRAALAGGPCVLQYRDKNAAPADRVRRARELARLCRENAVLFVVNDDPKLAAEVNADGVHVGQHDTPLRTAREILGEKAVIGVTCHDSLELAQTAGSDGADYVAFGRFFPSVTKPDASSASTAFLRRACDELTIPVAAIGGITAANARAIIDAGADMVAVSAAVFSDPDPRSVAARLAAFF